MRRPPQAEGQSDDQGPRAAAWPGSPPSRTGSTSCSRRRAAAERSCRAADGLNRCRGESRRTSIARCAPSSLWSLGRPDADRCDEALQMRASASGWGPARGFATPGRGVLGEGGGCQRRETIGRWRAHPMEDKRGVGLPADAGVVAARRHRRRVAGSGGWEGQGQRIAESVRAG